MPKLKKPAHLIFEGAELTGKSATIYPVWNTLEQIGNSGSGVMDGCVWMNTDLGIFGTKDGWPLINGLKDVIKKLDHKNLIFEKFHFTQMIYTDFSDQKQFKHIEKFLLHYHFRVIITTVRPDPKIFEKRLAARIRGTPSYQRIAQPISWYIEKQEHYIRLSRETKLPCLIIDNSVLPNSCDKKILSWLSR